MSVGVKEASVHRANPSPELRPDEFEWIRRFPHQQSGIALNDSKRALVTGAGRGIGKALAALAPGQRTVVSAISVEGRSIGETAANDRFVEVAAAFQG